MRRKKNCVQASLSMVTFPTAQFEQTRRPRNPKISKKTRPREEDEGLNSVATCKLSSFPSLTARRPSSRSRYKPAVQALLLPLSHGSQAFIKEQVQAGGPSSPPSPLSRMGALSKALKFLTTMLNVALTISLVVLFSIYFCQYFFGEVDENPCSKPINFCPDAAAYSSLSILFYTHTWLLVQSLRLSIAWSFGSHGDEEEGEEALFASCTPSSIFIRIWAVAAAAGYLVISVLTTTAVSYVIQIVLHCINSSIDRPLKVLLALIHTANVIIVVVVLSNLVKNWRGRLADFIVRCFSTPVALIGGGISLTQLAAFVRRGSTQVEMTKQQQLGTTAAD